MECYESVLRVEIATPFREIAGPRDHFQHGLTCTRSQYGARQLWPVRLSPIRPQEVIGFGELLSELITMARMLRPPPRIKTGSALLTYGVRRRRRTLSYEKRCGQRLRTQ